MARALVLDAPATVLLNQAEITNEWFTNFEIGGKLSGIRRVEFNDTIYLLSTNANEHSRLLVVATDILKKLHVLQYGFDHILHVGLAHFDRRVTIPVSFHQFNQGSQISVYASPLTKGSQQRIYFERAPDGNNQNIYVYNLTNSGTDLNQVELDVSLYREATLGLIDAILQDESQGASQEAHGIELVAPLASAFVGSLSLAEWYDKKLTKQQRDFVAKDLKRPVRLRGAAGTGKTLALVIKCLREAFAHGNDEHQFRIAFITHSHALAHDVVRNMMDVLAPSLSIQSNLQSVIWLGSLYELIQDIMGYERKQLEPLSLDGSEGREFQRLIIEDAVRETLSDPAVFLVYQHDCSNEFLDWLDIERRPRLLELLSNEFASLLDADGIRLGNAAADRYRTQKREAWQLPAPEPADRDLILRIHDRYCELLDASGMLSMDQMVADFSKYLETHEWRQLKEREGFNMVLVDELHYFNHMERMTLHHLFRKEAVVHGNCPLFTAQDIRQSTSDVALSRTSIGLRVGQSDSVEFTKVFRSTKAIALFLRHLDGAFPALALNEEWGEPPSESAREAGDTPVIKLLDTEIAVVDFAFELARVAARRLGGRNVAVLCTDDRAFEEYQKWGRLDGKFTLVNSRDSLGRLKYSGQRPVFSIPDYVAGLQFHTVVILNAERYQENVIDRTLGEKRQFISRLYLGASRASDVLSFACSTGRGGIADALTGAIDGGCVIVK